ncbi:MAG TPA: phosphatidylserine/phosphatidylglycerophosphate/cardiolipin synthase family protein [Chloroflexota bacterium]|nr:phosphatidylserine/phosphatidylglycerophosphate/cardiolipin synthase family protein [Chloroflexota bacterium]
MCDAATRSIDLEQYIFGMRGVGIQLLELLAAKARQGVAVRVLADGLGSYGLARSAGGRALIRNGGGIAMYNGISDVLRSPMDRAHRLHRKTVICDGEQVMVGGTCYHQRMSDWRDTMIRVDGPLPPAIASEFTRAWLNANKVPHEALSDTQQSRVGNSGWSYAVSGPVEQTAPNLRKAVEQRISAAERSVLLTTPYLIPDQSLWKALTKAAARGIRVTVMMPARSDHRGLDVVGRRFAHALVRRNVEVRGYSRGMLHAKIALVDGNWSSVSSFNLDLFSAKLNLENGIMSTSQALYESLADQVNSDLACSVRL